MWGWLICLMSAFVGLMIAFWLNYQVKRRRLEKVQEQWRQLQAMSDAYDACFGEYARLQLQPKVNWLKEGF